MMRALNMQANLQQLLDHVVADVSEVVNRWDGEVTTLIAGLVAAVTALFDTSGIPSAFDRIDVVVRLMLIGFKPNVVKDVELSFSAEIDSVGNTC